MAEYQRKPERFVSSGISMAAPADLLPEGKYPYLKNVRTDRQGSIRPRPGLTDLNDTDEPPAPTTLPGTSTRAQFLRRLNDEIEGTYLYVVKDDAGVLSADPVDQAGPLTSQDTGFSSGATATPLTSVIQRPISSPRPWMYLADGSRMRKIRAGDSGTAVDTTLVHKIGLPPPGTPPADLVLDVPNRKTIDLFDYNADGVHVPDPPEDTAHNWAHTGRAQSPTRASRVNTTITALLYDNTETGLGWACVEPASISGFQPGMDVIVEDGQADEETVIVQSLHQASTANTIASIVYDSGTTGLCSIVLTTPLEEIETNSYIRFDSGGAADERVRVLSVARSPEGDLSFRCSTTIQQVVGNAVVALASFRAYFTKVAVATDTLIGNAMSSVMDHTGGTDNEWGYLTNTISLNLAEIVSGEPTRDSDLIHISSKYSVLKNLVEGRIEFSLDTQGFASDYYFYSFRPSDLTPAVAGDTTMLSNREEVVRRNLIDQPLTAEERAKLDEAIQNEKARNITEAERDAAANENTVSANKIQDLPEYDPDIPTPWEVRKELGIISGVPTSSTSESSGQLPTGDDTWMELVFRVGDLVRVGADKSKSLKDVDGVRLSFLVSDDVTVTVDSIWLAGGGGLESGDIGLPYIYRYRGRSTLTGTRGNYSPASRLSVLPRRQGVWLHLSPHPDVNDEGGNPTQVDRLDVDRFGGSLLGWRYVGSTRNFAAKTIESSTDPGAGVGPIVVTITGHGFQTGDTCHITGHTTNVSANGIWKLTRVTADTFSLDGSLGTGTVGGGNDGTVEPAFFDDLPDLTVQATPSSGNTNYQLWPTTGPPKIVDDDGDPMVLSSASGTSIKVSGANGNEFSMSWAPGTVIFLAGKPYTIYRVVSTTFIETVENVGNPGAVQWEVLAPTLLQQNLPSLFGPFEGFTFGCGDSNNPGRLYFSNGNNPDSTQDINWIEITSPTEPLQNGVLYNGRCYVFSTERMFALYPAFNEPQRFRVVEVPGGRGLWSRYGLTVGPAIWFIGQDGIYVTTGGESVSITDKDLYPIFPHEGNAGETTNLIIPPDFDTEEDLRLTYYDDYLYFDHKNTDGEYQTLVYCTREGFDGWYYDQYNAPITISGSTDASPISVTTGQQHGVNTGSTVTIVDHTTNVAANGTWTVTRTGRNTFTLDGSSGSGAGAGSGGTLLPHTRSVVTSHYGLEGEGNHGMLCTTTLPSVVTMTGTSGLDDNAFVCQVRTPSRNQGDFRSRKRYGDVALEATADNTTLAVIVGFDNYQETDSAPLISQIPAATYPGFAANNLTYSHRQTQIVEVDRLATNIGLDISWASVTDTPRLHHWDPSFLVRPEDVRYRPTDWDDAGSPGLKHFRGAILHADTDNISRQVQILYDGSREGPVLTVTHDGNLKVPYGFTPFDAHQVKLVPVSPDTWRLFSVQWIFDQRPEVAPLWSDWTDCGQPGIKFMQGVLIEADTGGKKVPVDILYGSNEPGDSQVGATLNVIHSGRKQIFYAFPATFMAHEVRFQPHDDWQFFRAEWVFARYPETTLLINDWTNDGQIGAKFLQGVVLEADTSRLLKEGGDAHQVISSKVQVEVDGRVLEVLDVTHDGRLEKPYSFREAPICHMFRLVPVEGDIAIHAARWVWKPKPELTDEVADWTDAEYMGAKFMQGFLLEAETDGDVKYEVQYDGGTVAEVFDINHVNQRIKPYSFEDPFICHLIRGMPQANYNMRQFRVQWIFEPAPELAQYWQTPPVTHDIPGFMHIFYLYIAHVSTSDLSLVVTVDGVDQSALTISNSGGVYTKTLVRVPVYKGKSYEYRLTSSAAFRLYKQDCEVHVGQWGRETPYAVLRPFGGPSVKSGALI